MKRLFIGSIICISMGCAQQHVTPYVPKKRDFPVGPITQDEIKRQNEAQMTGSLWQQRNAAHTLLFSDARAFQTNDIVVIDIEESANAERKSDTSLSRSSGSSGSVTSLPFLGSLLGAMTIGDEVPTLDVEGDSSGSFRGEGTTGRTEKLTGTVSAVVKKVLPNGNLFVEGHRVILVNDEEQHFYISGIIRPIDINQNNVISSSKVAEAEIEFVGRGIMSDNQTQGWFSRYFGWVYPF
jgi:flagellar L-ring protein precursor FlgH